MTDFDSRKAINLLDAFRQKAGAWQSQYKANQLYKQLRKYLTSNEDMDLQIAWDHYKNGFEGAGELYDICARIKERMTNGF